MNDPDDVPTRKIGGKENRPRLASAEDDVPTARLADTSRPPATRPIQPVPTTTVSFEPDHVVTRRISGPRRLDPIPEQNTPDFNGVRRLPGFQTQVRFTEEVELPVGWLVLVSGPGRGHYFAVFTGMNSLGREAGNRICVDYGDDKISRQDHCFITFDDEKGTFWIQHGGKSNLVRVNDEPVMAPIQIATGDYIRVGVSKFRFVALCDDRFSWNEFE